LELALTTPDQRAYVAAVQGAKLAQQARSEIEGMELAGALDHLMDHVIPERQARRREAEQVYAEVTAAGCELTVTHGMLRVSDLWLLSEEQWERIVRLRVDLEDLVDEARSST
jgi:hypothetical protein